MNLVKAMVINLPDASETEVGKNCTVSIGDTEYSGVVVAVVDRETQILQVRDRTSDTAADVAGDKTIGYTNIDVEKGSDSEPKKAVHDGDKSVGYTNID
jgi:hypothetical protein